jgi:2'-5' RNA ligase
MKTEQLFFIAVIPPEPIKNELQKIKQDFADNYGATHALKSPPHITLIPPFNLNAQTEPAITEFLNANTQGTNPFPVTLMDYSCFIPRVIFLNPLFSRELEMLQKRLENAFYKRFPLGKPSSRPYHPHLTIAFRDLTPKTFYEAWARYEKQAYKAQFQVDRLCLLRHNGVLWEEYKEFKFTNLMHQ